MKNSKVDKILLSIISLTTYLENSSESQYLISSDNNRSLLLWL